MERLGTPHHPPGLVQTWSLNRAEIVSPVGHRPIPVFREPLNLLEMPGIVDGLVQLRLNHVLKLSDVI